MKKLIVFLSMFVSMQVFAQDINLFPGESVLINTNVVRCMQTTTAPAPAPQTPTTPKVFFMNGETMISINANMSVTLHSWGSAVKSTVRLFNGYFDVKYVNNPITEHFFMTCSDGSTDYVNCPMLDIFRDNVYVFTLFKSR